MKELSVKECLTVGWTHFKSRPWVFVLAGIVLFLASMVADMPRSYSHGLGGSEMSVVGLVFFIVSVALTFLISMGKTAFYLRAYDSVSSVEVKDLWHPTPYWKFVGAAILAGGATILGLVLLIVPGIIVGIMVGFTLYIVIDKGSMPIDAVKESIELTKGNRWNLFVLGLAILGINILGILAVFVGLLVSMPVSTLAVVHAYRVLSGNVVKEPIEV